MSKIKRLILVAVILLSAVFALTLGASADPKQVHNCSANGVVYCDQEPQPVYCEYVWYQGFKVYDCNVPD